MSDIAIATREMPPGTKVFTGQLHRVQRGHGKAFLIFDFQFPYRQRVPVLPTVYSE